MSAAQPSSWDQLADLILKAQAATASQARQSARYCAGIGDDATEQALLADANASYSVAVGAMWAAFYDLASTSTTPTTLCCGELLVRAGERCPTCLQAAAL